MSWDLDPHAVFWSRGTSQVVTTGHILRFQKSLVEFKIPNNIKSTKTFVKIQLHIFILQKKPEILLHFAEQDLEMQCTVLADNRDEWTQACPGSNAPSAPSPPSLTLAPAAYLPDELGAGSYQDLSTFKESQQDDPRDPWLPARDNVTMKPLVWSHPQFACYHQPEQLINEGIRAGLSPTRGTIFVTWYLMMSIRLRVAQLSPPWCFRLSEHHLALAMPAHSLPSAEEAPGNQSPGMARWNERGCACMPSDGGKKSLAMMTWWIVVATPVRIQRNQKKKQKQKNSMISNPYVLWVPYERFT